MREVLYPNFKALSYKIPTDWIIYSDERIGFQSDDGEIEVSGTLYQACGRSLKEFFDSRTQGLLSAMPWYKVTDSPINQIYSGFSSYKQGFCGVWPSETKETYCQHFCLAIDKYFLGITFTCLYEKQDKYIADINSIMNSINIRPNC